MNNVVNQIPYLRTSRDFPEEIHQLTVEINKTYVDIANAVNNRIISIFPVKRPALTGESWFLKENFRQQTFRQVYNITSYTNFNHNIDTSSIALFTVIRGMGFNGTNYFPIPFVNGSDPTGQVEIFANSSQVKFVAGVNAPTITTGFILLEWLSQP